MIDLDYNATTPLDPEVAGIRPSTAKSDEHSHPENVFGTHTPNSAASPSPTSKWKVSVVRRIGLSPARGRFSSCRAS
jgi:hypothetical protein